MSQISQTELAQLVKELFFPISISDPYVSEYDLDDASFHISRRIFDGPSSVEITRALDPKINADTMEKLLMDYAQLNADYPTKDAYRKWASSENGSILNLCSILYNNERRDLIYPIFEVLSSKFGLATSGPIFDKKKRSLDFFKSLKKDDEKSSLSKNDQKKPKVESEDEFIARIAKELPGVDISRKLCYGLDKTYYLLETLDLGKDMTLCHKMKELGCNFTTFELFRREQSYQHGKKHPAFEFYSTWRHQNTGTIENLLRALFRAGQHANIEELLPKIKIDLKICTEKSILEEKRNAERRAKEEKALLEIQDWNLNRALALSQQESTPAPSPVLVPTSKTVVDDGNNNNNSSQRRILVPNTATTSNLPDEAPVVTKPKYIPIIVNGTETAPPEARARRDLADFLKSPHFKKFAMSLESTYGDYVSRFISPWNSRLNKDWGYTWDFMTIQSNLRRMNFGYSPIAAFMEEWIQKKNPSGQDVADRCFDMNHDTSRRHLDLWLCGLPVSTY